MTTQRAYSLLTVKAVNDDERTITGIATTPSTDREGDIVESKGAEFKLPIALLWQHDASKPIGQVVSAKVTSAGIEIKARIARIEEAGTLRDRIDEAWHSIKAGLVRGLSIGFRGLAAEPLPGGGLRFTKWNWLELSAVTIPANADASITAVKAAHAAQTSIPDTLPTPRPSSVKLISASNNMHIDDARTKQTSIFGRPGLGAIRVLKSLAVARNDGLSAEAFALAHRWAGEQHIAEYIKAPVSTADRANSGLTSPVGADFLNALRPLTLLGRMPVRRLPSRTRLLTQSTPFKAFFVKEGKPIPMSGGAFTASSLDVVKVAALTVVSNELLQAASGSADMQMLDDLAAACAEAIDRAFIDPLNAGVADEKPASITNGAASITSTGATFAAIDTDLKAAGAALIAQGCDLTNAYWVMSSRLALIMSLMRGSGGTFAYPELGPLGGRLAGLPVLTTAAADTASGTTSNIALIDPTQIGFAEGEPTLATSQRAAIDLNTAPGTAGMVTPISLFQAEATALRASIPIDWKARRPATVVIKGIAL